MFLPVRFKSFFLARVLAIALRRCLSFALALVFGLTSVVSWPQPAQAQTGLPGIITVETIRTGSGATLTSPTTTVEFADPCDPASFPGCAGVDVDLTYGVQRPTGQEGNLVLQSFDAGGLTFTRENIVNEQVAFRRNNDPTFERDVLFYETATPAGPLPAAIDLFPELAAQIPDALLSPIINRGVDNIFNNVGINVQDSRNNLERIDYIINGGLEIPANELNTSGYLILERGIGDAVGIAAITAVTGGLPSAYGPLIQIPADQTLWNTTTSPTLETIVFRRDVGEPDLRPSHRVAPQQVRGLFFPISALIDTTAGTPQTVFGYSLVAGDVAPGTDLTQFQNFPTNTDGTTAGGLDLVAGGFGLFRAPPPPPPPPGNLFINKRITELTVSGTVVPRTELQNGNDNGVPELVAAGLGQGAVNVTDQQLQPGDEIEYTLYFNNTLTGTVTDVVICDAVPGGTTFIPDTYGAGAGLQLAPPTAPQAPPYPTTVLTNAAGDDGGTFLPAGTVLPEFCRNLDQGNGAITVTVPQVAGGQVGFVRFKARVNDPTPTP